MRGTSVIGNRGAMSESDTNLASMRTRAEALLARYGGQNGPTGHAAVDGSGEPPVSYTHLTLPTKA